ncbi:hypothetical protein GYA27_04750, partial [candidate division WWE3 bacterium]|nr:hypothetical protein [candidate division WWE3 bacterium]
MSVFNALNPAGPERNRGLFKLLAYLIVLAGLFISANFLWPEVVGTMLNILWILMLVAVVVFFAIGLMVVFGLRKEANQILDILLEGTLTFIDLLDFIKLVYRRFITVLKDFILYATPVFAYVLCFVLYVLIIILFKSVGALYDVTGLTIGLTFVMVFAFGLINKPRNILPDLSVWKNQFMDKFRSSFIDGVEIVLFIFFLTMDSKNLFFLPQSLKIELHAIFNEYNLMTRSFVASDHLKTTVNLVLAAVIIEIVRNFLKIIVAARNNYSIFLQNIPFEERPSKSLLIKRAVRRTFGDLKDDLVKFITYTTVLFAVFMLFPRLKILTLVVMSTTNLFLDILIPSRLTASKGTDLISRTL